MTIEKAGEGGLELLDKVEVQSSKKWTEDFCACRIKYKGDEAWVATTSHFMESWEGHPNLIDTGVHLFAFNTDERFRSLGSLDSDNAPFFDSLSDCVKVCINTIVHDTVKTEFHNITQNYEYSND